MSLRYHKDSRALNVAFLEEGQAGVRLISACKPAGADFSLLIDRGFVADGVSARPRVIETSLPLVLIGELDRKSVV